MTLGPQLALPLRCQRWRRRRDLYRPAGEPLDPSRYGVEPLEEGPARAFVVEHHYSGTFPAARFRAGLYRTGGELVGVAVFSVPMQPRAITRWTGTRAGVELGRFVLLDEVPANAESWFLARAFRLLRDQLPDVRTVLSYSDPVPRHAEGGRVVMPGHLGIIYRAHNGRFVGRSSKRTLLLGPDGRAVSGRALTKIRRGERGAGYAERQLVEMGYRGASAVSRGRPTCGGRSRAVRSADFDILGIWPTCGAWTAPPAARFPEDGRT